MNYISKFKERIKSYSLSPIAGVVVVVGSVLVGIILSAMIEDIQRATPISWIKGEWGVGDTLVLPALLFWLIFGFVAITAGLKEYFKYHEGKKYKLELENAKAELKSNIESVKEIASTMPPKNYLSIYSEAYYGCAFSTDHIYSVVLMSLIEQAKPETHREELNLVIRIILDAVINLAFVYDTPHFSKNVRYSANILWVKSASYIQSDSSKKKLWSAAKDLSSFNNSTAFFSSVDELLILDKNLSTNSENIGIPEVDSLDPLCLGFRFRTNEKGFNLPGAPQSLEKNHYSYVSDSSNVVNKLTQYGESARERVRQYFSNDKQARSSISMPIAGYDAATADKRSSIIAVLSIRCDEPDIMKGDHRADMFYHHIVPVLGLLYRLCWLRSKLDELAGREIVEYTDVKQPTFKFLNELRLRRKYGFQSKR